MKSYFQLTNVEYFDENKPKRFITLYGKNADKGLFFKKGARIIFESKAYNPITKELKENQEFSNSKKPENKVEDPAEKNQEKFEAKLKELPNLLESISKFTSNCKRVKDFCFPNEMIFLFNGLPPILDELNQMEKVAEKTKIKFIHFQQSAISEFKAQLRIIEKIKQAELKGKLEGMLEGRLEEKLKGRLEGELEGFVKACIDFGQTQEQTLLRVKNEGYEMNLEQLQNIIKELKKKK